MISRSGNGNILARRYDWLVAGVGVLALAGAAVVFAMSLGADAESEAAEAVRSVVTSKRPAETGVASVDMTAFEAAAKQAERPPQVTDVADRKESFMASERRVKCICGKVIPANIVACSFCSNSLVVVNKVDEEAKKRERWEKLNQVAADDGDADNDGFTNAEEYAAGTNPTDAKDHPDYLASLRLQLPLKTTMVPFVLSKANKIPNGWRCEFFDPTLKDDYGRMGRKFTATLGEELVVVLRDKTGRETKKSLGYRLEACEQKSELQPIANSTGMKRSVDVSEAKVVRLADGKSVTIVRGVKNTPVDVQATLVYERRGTKTFDVITGSEIDLNGTKYKIVAVKQVGESAEVVLENPLTGKTQTLKPLE